METIDREVLKGKIIEHFPEKIVRKDLTKKIKEGANVPVKPCRRTFVKPTVTATGTRCPATISLSFKQRRTLAGHLPFRKSGADTERLTMALMRLLVCGLQIGRAHV